MTQGVLRPRVAYAPGPDGSLPDAETRAAMHHEARQLCYLAKLGPDRAAGRGGR